jgi:hypothetical protein
MNEDTRSRPERHPAEELGLKIEEVIIASKASPRVVVKTLTILLVGRHAAARNGTIRQGLKRTRKCLKSFERFGRKHGLLDEGPAVCHPANAAKPALAPVEADKPKPVARARRSRNGGQGVEASHG